MAPWTRQVWDWPKAGRQSILIIPTIQTLVRDQALTHNHTLFCGSVLVVDSFLILPHPTQKLNLLIFFHNFNSSVIHISDQYVFIYLAILYICTQNIARSCMHFTVESRNERFVFRNPSIPKLFELKNLT